MKKTFRFLMAAACAALLLPSCSSSSTDPRENVDFYPVKLEGSNDWSFVNAKGEVVCEDEFVNRPTAVVNGYFSVRHGNRDDSYSSETLYDVYRMEGDKAKEVEKLSGLVSVGYFDNGMIGIVRPDERITFVDEDGNDVLTLKPQNGKEIIASDLAFHDDLLVVVLDDSKRGFVDKTGKLVIKAKYDGVSQFHDGKALAIVRNQDDDSQTLYVIDKTGKELAKTSKNFDDFVMMDGRTFTDGLLAACEKVDGGDYRWGFLNEELKFEKVSTKVKRILEYNGKLFTFRNDAEKWGIMSRDGETLVSAKYEGIAMIDDDLFLADKGEGKLRLINSKGEEIESKINDYERALPLIYNGFGFFAKDGSIWVLTDDRGEKLGNNEFKDFDISLAPTEMLESDYMDVTELATALADFVNTDKVGRYTIGSCPSNYLTNASNYSYSDSFSPDEDEADQVTYNDYTFRISRVECSERIATYDYDYYSYSGYYRFNPSCRITGASVTCSDFEGKLWRKLKKALAQAYEARGLRVIDTNDTRVVLGNGSTQVSVSKDDYQIVIAVSPQRYYSEEALYVEAEAVEEAEHDHYYAPADSAPAEAW